MLKTIARGNGMHGKIDISLRAQPIPVIVQASDSVISLFTSPRLTTVSVILCYAWFVVGGCYYGLTLAAGHIGTDIYTGDKLNAAGTYDPTHFTKWGLKVKQMI